MKINLIKGAKALLLATALLVNTVVSTSYIKAEEAVHQIQVQSQVIQLSQVQKMAKAK